jgi:hypothetical protein
MEISIVVNKTGYLRLKIKFIEKEKERDAWRRFILKKLTVAELLSDIPHVNGT